MPFQLDSLEALVFPGRNGSRDASPGSGSRDAGAGSGSGDACTRGFAGVSLAVSLWPLGKIVLMRHVNQEAEDRGREDLKQLLNEKLR